MLLTSTNLPFDILYVIKWQLARRMTLGRFGGNHGFNTLSGLDRREEFELVGVGGGFGVRSDSEARFLRVSTEIR